MRKTYDQLIDKLFILDYKGGKYLKYEPSKKGVEEKMESKTLDSSTVNEIISEICNYLIR